MKYDAIEADALWVIELFGSDVNEAKEPGSKAKAQAKRIAEFARQWDRASHILESEALDLVSLKAGCLL